MDTMGTMSGFELADGSDWGALDALPLHALRPAPRRRIRLAQLAGLHPQPSRAGPGPVAQDDDDFELVFSHNALIDLGPSQGDPSH